MVRKVAAVLAGIAVVGVFVAGLQSISARLYPLPAGVEFGTQAFEDFIAGLPLTAWILVFSSEVLGGFLGALVAGWIARDHPRAFSTLIVGLAVVGSMVNWVSFTHPPLFIVGQLVAYPLALWAAWAVLEKSGVSGREAVAAAG